MMCANSWSRVNFRREAGNAALRKMTGARELVKVLTPSSFEMPKSKVTTTMPASSNTGMVQIFRSGPGGRRKNWRMSTARSPSARPCIRPGRKNGISRCSDPGLAEQAFDARLAQADARVELRQQLAGRLLRLRKNELYTERFTSCRKKKARSSLQRGRHVFPGLRWKRRENHPRAWRFFPGWP